MTYSSGGLIQATDYNGFVSTTAGANVNATWNTAYGQTALTTVAAAATITATQWATLNTTISSMAAHQGTTVTSRTNPTAGDTIAILSNLSTDIGSCYTNRWNAASSGAQYTSYTGAQNQAATTGSGTNPWTLTFTDTVTFANATAATNFFNAGGYFKIAFAKTSTGVSTSDPEWNTFVTSTCGTLYFTVDGAAKTIAATSYTGTKLVGGTGTPTTLLTGTGFNQLTSSPVAIYKQFDSGAAYSSNYVQVSVAYSAPTLTFTTVWFEAGGGGTSGSAIAGGAFGVGPTTAVTYFPPETTNLTNTWGTPTIAASVVAS